MYAWSLSLSFALSCALVNAHAETDSRSLPDTWYQSETHPAHALFRRQSSGSFPAVGSAEWKAGFPQTADTGSVPKAWTDALNAAVAAGKIPNVPVSSQPNGPSTTPVYQDQDASKQPICSASAHCRLPGQIWDAPSGVVGISFDDGPLAASDELYSFLQQNNVPSTHFFIGTNILQFPNEFTTAFSTLKSDIAVHTWTHPYMTTLSNAQVVAQLGWTMQLIYISTGGRLARYWRPPYGDTDARVDAIASAVFGLTTVIWNQDTSDWSLGTTGGTTQDAIDAKFTQWLSGSKSPGLIILEHELRSATVQAFKDNFPKYAQYGWDLESVARINGASYQNAQSSSGSLTYEGSVAGA
ncbi:unnamed protein product [Peniophora sp. CBMAI 1063]|nr:unnamed protein product [Peniophora sp. CBMAI 1063]